jgi:hypothetical protein
MRAHFRPIVAALSLACLPLLMAAALVGGALAQKAEPAEPPAKQIALSEKQIQGVIAAKAEIDAMLAKLPDGADQPDPKVLVQLDAVVKKHGFANYAEYEEVDDNITLVLAGIDPETKKYVGDEAVLKAEIADVQADKQMAANDKKEALAQLNDSLKSVKPLQFPANTPLVLKYYDKLSDAALTKQ